MVYGHIYKIENLMNGKVYIGQTTRNPIKRKRDHINTLKLKTHANPHLQQAFNKYGEPNFKFTVLNYATNKETLDSLETIYIEKYHTLDDEYGYNLKTGGSQGKLSSTTRKRMSESRTGEKNPMYGKIFSKEHRLNIGKSLKGKKLSAEHREKLSEIFKGRKFNLQHRQKIGLAQRGRGLFGFTGVYFRKDLNPEKKCWMPQIKYYGHPKSLGLCHDPLTAEIIHDLVFNEIYN